MPAPTLVSYVETVWNTTGANKSLPTTSWLNGDLIVVAALTEDFACAVTVANQFGLTFTSTTVGTAAATCFAGTYTATATSDQTSVAVAAVSNDGGANTHDWGVALWVFRGHGGVGTPASDKTAAKTVSLVRAAANSMVVEAIGDFSAAVTTSYSFTPTVGNDRQHAQFTPRYTIYVADFGDQGAPGTTSYGTSGEASTGPFTKIAVEVKGVPGGGGGMQPQQRGSPAYRRRRRQQLPFPGIPDTGLGPGQRGTRGSGAIAGDASARATYR